MAVSTTRADGLTFSTDLAQAGATFNDATRLLDGGLWSTPTDANGQMNYLGSFLADAQTVLKDVTADLAPGATVTVGGTAYTLTAADVTALQDVQKQLNTMITDAPNAIGNSHAATAAHQALHAADAAILNDINGDPGLAAALANAPIAATTGATDVGFQALTAGSDNRAAISAATAQGATLGQIGNVFNAATDLAVGGLNHANLHEFNADMKAVAAGLGNIVHNATELASIEAGETPQEAALTTIHLQTLEEQALWQVNTVGKEFANNPNVAARSTNDNLLDMIDIVQNDGNLNTAAGGNGTAGHVGGFAEMPGFLSGTITQFQDNQAQTNFWAQFVAEANTINNQLTAVAGGQTTDIQGLITQIENYNGFGASFAKSQGGTFGARFENELTQGTLLADSNTAVAGLKGIMAGDTGAALTADQAKILAAGQGFVADANDVSGNNIPVGGGSYVGTSTTVAGATSVAGLAQGSIPVGPAANGQTGLSSAAREAGDHEPLGGGGFDGQGGGLGQPVMDPGHHWHM
jgi:hypothetical protein